MSSGQMKLTDQIKQCRTPQEALLLLAEAIDSLAADTQQVDPWEERTIDWSIIDTPTSLPERPTSMHNHDFELPERRSTLDAKGQLVTPPADPRRKEIRRAFAETYKLEAEGILPDAYAEHGPLWLYYGDRDFVMSLPLTARQVMVADIMEDSPSEAAEVGRDILMLKDGITLGSAIEGHLRDVASK